jgi:hypothetical protein
MVLGIRMYSKILFLCLFFSLFYGFDTQAQALEANHWLFGIKSGLRFYPDSIQPVSFNKSLKAQHATSTISDKDGRLLFYSGLFSGGGWQSDTLFNSRNKPITFIPYYLPELSLIQKIPESSEDYYYIYSNGNPFNNGAINYVWINIKNPQDSGRVITNKSGTLNFITDFAISILDHANDTDKWLVCRSDTGNYFYAIPITRNGLQISSMVTTKIGTYIPWSSLYARPMFRSENVKSSPNSNYLAITYQHPSNILEILKFNNNTGVFTSGFYSFNTLFPEFTPLSFSPNSKYLIFYYNTGIHAVDVSSEDSSTITSTLKNVYSLLSTAPPYQIGDIQIAIDGNIYYTDMRSVFQYARKLSRIKCPDMIMDTAIFEDSIVGPFGIHMGLRLPTLNQTLYVNSYKLQSQNLTADTICPGDTAQLVAYGASMDGFYWSPSVGLSCTNCSSPKASPTVTTTYKVVGRATSCLRDVIDSSFVTVYVKPILQLYSIVADTGICPDDSVLLRLSLPTQKTIWSTGDTSVFSYAHQPGIYTAQVITDCFSAQIQHLLKPLPAPVFRISPKDTTVCYDTEVLLKGFSPDTIHWSNGSLSDSMAVYYYGRYIEYAYNQCGRAYDTAIVRHSQPSAQFVADSTEGFAPFAFSAFSKPGQLQRRWLLNGQDVGSDSVLRVINLPTDTYNLVLAVVDSIGCTDTFRMQLRVFPPPVPPVPEPEPEPETPDSTHRDCQIKVFPNPFHTEFVVKAVVSTHKIKQVRLVSAEGKILFEEAMPAGANPLHLHLGSHPAAVYMLRYTCRDSVYRVKVVKD